MNDLAHEQTLTETPQSQDSAPTADAAQRDWGAFRDVRLRLTVEAGRTRLTVRDILEIREGSLITTAKGADEPLDVCLGDEIFYRAEVTVKNDKLWARLTKIVGGQL